MAVESDLEEIKKDYAELVGLTPPADKAKADETPPAKDDKAEKPAETKDEEKAPEKPAETPPEKDEEEHGRWDKPLQREQQKRAALEKQVSDLQTQLAEDRKAQAKRDKEWKKLLEVNGIEPEADEAPPPATPPKADEPAPDASTPAEEARMELATAQRERMFAKIERQHPDFDADQAWSDSISEILELHGIDPKSTELPAGLTMAALETAAGKVFNHKLTAHQKKTPPTAPRKPPTTRGGGSGTPRNVSHVPAASPTTPDTYDFAQECRALTGQTEE